MSVCAHNVHQLIKFIIYLSNYIIRQVFNENLINEVSYKMWTNTVKCTLSNVTSDSYEFIEKLIKDAEVLLRHDFIEKMQSKFYNQVKKILTKMNLL